MHYIQCMYTNYSFSIMNYICIPFTVSVPPTISTPPLSERVTEGDTGQFVCKVQGTPYPVTRVSWLKEDKPVDVSSKYCLAFSHKPYATSQ